MNCPKCKSNHSRKDGIVKGKQRFKCKDCNHRFTVELKSTAQAGIGEETSLGALP